MKSHTSSPKLTKNRIFILMELKKKRTFFSFQTTAELKRADLLKVLEVADIIKEREEFAKQREQLELQRTRLALVREGGTLPTATTPTAAAHTAPPATAPHTAPTATQDEKIEEIQKTILEMQKNQSTMDAKLDKILAGKFDSCFYFPYRVDHHVSDLGWVDLDLESSPAGGPLLSLATAQEGWRNIQNLSQPNPGPRRDGPPCILSVGHINFISGSATGFPGEKLSFGHAELDQAINLAAAYFPSISCRAFCGLTRYTQFDLYGT